VSGLDADGAEALNSIKEVGGITIAQTPDTAEWSDMPESAINTGHIDFVLSLEDIAKKIAEIGHAFPGKATGVSGSD
ncbi:MAG: chemotaxis protein CheB, partial [Terriglobia bacterium]